MPLFRRFLDSVPEYLARHYWWAYLWRPSIWFFDHQSIINLILFGQYKALMRQTLSLMQNDFQGRCLQLTCVYGQLTPRLLSCLPQGLHLADVALPQLELARRKCSGRGRLFPVRMNAETLAYADNAFDTIVVFFLFHEMPRHARHRTCREIARVLKPGGRLLITEYACQPASHPLYRFPASRWLLGRLEPFLPGFWAEDLPAVLADAAAGHGKQMCPEGAPATAFQGFYHVRAFRCGAI